MSTKYKGKIYSSQYWNCSKRVCFVPFNGNGQPICRLWELGRCPDGKIGKKEKITL
jgi:hypothetical protein